MDDFRKSIPNAVPNTDRIWTTEIGSYNQVIALTQWMINTGIQNFYTYLKTNGKLPKPATIAPNPNEALSNAVFGPPAVMIEASTANFTSVKLHLTLQSGVAKVIQKYEAPSEANDNNQLLEIAYLKMKDMHVIVPCNIDFIDLNPNSDRGKEMKARMNAGDHSIYQLLVNLASAAWGDAVWDYGVWTNDDTVTVDASNGMPPQQRKPDGWVLGEKRDRAQLGTSLITHMEAMFKTLSRQFTEKGMLTMNYVKKFDIPTRKPTFDVNDTRLQTYPWVDAANNPVTPGLTGPGRLNYLCYLETVGTNTPPALSDKNVILSPFVNGARRGNWTDGVDPKQDAPTKFGNFVLSSTCFLEGYFLPKLENLNRLMRLDLDSIDCDITAEFASWHTTTKYTVAVGREYNGQNVPSSSDFQFKRSIFSVGNDWDGETKDWYKDWSESLPRGTLEYGWSWVHRHEKDKTNRYKHIGSVEEWTWGQTFTETRVLIVPGTSKILYHGKSWTKVNYKIDPSIIESNVSGGFIVTAKWHIIFTMKELSNGGLYFDIDTSPIEVNVPWNSDGESDPWPNAIKWQYKNAGNNFEFVVNGLRTALNETQTFIMPSSGVYFFKNPIFNHAGDLICELEYNGIGDDGSPPVNSDGVMDPNIAKPDFKDFKRAVTADGSQLTF